MRRTYPGFGRGLVACLAGRVPFLPRARRLLLLVSGAGATLARSRGRRIEEVKLLAPDAEGWLELDAMVKAHPETPVHIAIDSVDETYRSEVLPRVRGADWREMTQRRLHQLVHQTPYRAVLRQGPAREVAAGERHLFMGLTAPALLQPWLEVLRLRQAPIAGVWLTPVLAQSLLRRLRIDHPDVLLVAAQGDDLRLSYFARGELRYSRLASCAACARSEDPLTVQAEQIERTRLALVAQRILQRGASLHITILDPLDGMDGLAQRLTRLDSVSCEIVPRRRLLDRLGLSPDHLTQTGDVIFLSLLPDAPTTANLLPQDQQLPYRHHRLRHALLAAGTVSLATGVLVATALGLLAWRDIHATTRLEVQAAKAEDAVRHLLAATPAAHELESVWRARQAWRYVQARVADPTQSLAAIAAIARRETGIDLLYLQWRSPTEHSGPSILMEAEITPFDGDYIAADQRIEGLVQRLAAAGWRARVTRRPLAADAAQVLQGGFAPGQSSQRALFQLIVQSDASRT